MRLPRISSATTSPIPATGGVPAAGTLHLTPTRPAPGGAPAGGQGLVTRVYQADGLAADEKQAESLVRVIQRTVEPDSWDARGGPGVAEYFAAGKSLVVRQTADVHKQVDELLGLLREAGKKAAPPGRGVP